MPLLGHQIQDCKGLVQVQVQVTHGTSAFFVVWHGNVAQIENPPNYSLDGLSLYF
jgi:hypothetical protein